MHAEDPAVYTCNKFGVDDSSCFPLRARTHTDKRSHTTPQITLPTHRLQSAGLTVVNSDDKQDVSTGRKAYSLGLYCTDYYTTTTWGQSGGLCLSISLENVWKVANSYWKVTNEQRDVNTREVNKTREDRKDSFVVELTSTDSSQPVAILLTQFFCAPLKSVMSSRALRYIPLAPPWQSRL